VASQIEDLLTASLHRVFGERDAAVRRAAVDEIFAADVVFADAEGVVRGRDALSDKAGAILDGAPGWVFRDAGPVREAQDLGVVEWAFGPAGEPPVVTGMDVAVVADGRIATMHTLLTSPQP